MMRPLTLLSMLGLAMRTFAGWGGTGNLLDVFPKNGRSLAIGHVAAAPGPSIQPDSGFSLYSLYAPLPFGDNLSGLEAGFGKGRFSFYLGWRQAAGQGIEATELDTGTVADTIAYRMLGTIDEADNIYSASVALVPSDGWRLQAVLKHYRNEMGTARGGGVGADFGAAFLDTAAGMGAGLSVINIVPARIRYPGLGTERLPSIATIGLSKFIKQGKLAFFLDAKQALVSGSTPVLCLGGEFAPFPVVDFRAGLGEWEPGERGVVCLGAGLHASGFSLDYALNTFPDLGWQAGHRIGLSFRTKGFKWKNG